MPCRACNSWCVHCKPLRRGSCPGMLCRICCKQLHTSVFRRLPSSEQTLSSSSWVYFHKRKWFCYEFVISFLLYFWNTSMRRIHNTHIISIFVRNVNYFCEIWRFLQPQSLICGKLYPEQTNCKIHKNDEKISMIFVTLLSWQIVLFVLKYLRKGITIIFVQSLFFLIFLRVPIFTE